MTPCLLALSPHLDDAVFSAGGALAMRVEAGWRVAVAPLFAGNVAAPRGFALACQLDKGLGAEVDYMALRRAEDGLACALLGVASVHLPLLEAPHRGYDSAAELFKAPHTDDPVRQPLTEALTALIREHAPDELWAPRALGGHVDHVLVHLAVRSLGPVARRLWWTDWPYCDRAAPADPQADTVAGLDWVDVALSLQAQARKADACAAYVSQLGFLFGGEAARRRRRAAVSGERFAVEARP